MSEYIYDDEFENDSEETDEQELPEPARKHLRKKEKEAKELKKQLEEAQKEIAGFKVRDVLTERGVSDKRAHALLSKSGVELADPQKVDSWLDEYGDLFNYRAADQVDAAAVAADLSQLDRTEASGIPESGREELIAQIKNTPPDQLPALLQKNSHIKLQL